MITPDIINNIGSSVVWEITVFNGPVANTNVFVDVTIPGEFDIVSATLTKGAYDDVTKVWTLGDMSKNEVSKLIFVLKLTGTPQSFNETFNFTADVTGLDTDGTNNILEDEVTYKLISTQPLAGANPNTTSCTCVDVSINDTECSQGGTEWRLDETSIVNGKVNSWDADTGKGEFTPLDPTKSITFTYDLFCVQGQDEYEISPDTLVTIYPQLDSIGVFDHTLVQVKGSDLEASTVTLLEAVYSDISLEDYTWNLILNKEGVVTSGVPIPLHKELGGTLCDTNGKGRPVLVWNENGVVSYTMTDGSDYLGSPLDLGNCCCTEDGVLKYKFVLQHLEHGGLSTLRDDGVFPITLNINGVDNIINYDASWDTYANSEESTNDTNPLYKLYASLISQVKGLSALALGKNIIIELDDSFNDAAIQFDYTGGGSTDLLSINTIDDKVILSHTDLDILSTVGTNKLKYYTSGDDIPRDVLIPLNTLI